MWRLSLGAEAMASVHPVTCGKHQPDKERLLSGRWEAGRSWKKKKRGAHLQHMTVVRDMFQRYVKMTVMKESGGEGKGKKKSFGPCPGGKVHFCHQTYWFSLGRNANSIRSSLCRERKQGQRQHYLSSPCACHLPQPDLRREVVLNCHCGQV